MVSSASVFYGVSGLLSIFRPLSGSLRDVLPRVRKTPARGADLSDPFLIQTSEGID